MGRYNNLMLEIQKSLDDGCFEAYRKKYSDILDKRI